MNVWYKRIFVVAGLVVTYVEFKMPDATFLCFITVLKYVSLFWHEELVTGVPTNV